MRCVTALLSPSLLRSPDVKQPPFSLFRKLREHSSWLPSCVTRCVDCVDNTVVDAAFLPRLDVHRRALRLQLCPNGVYRNYFLCERSLLFVPEWFAPPQPETWPLGLSQVGWPLEPPNPRESNPEPPTAPSIPDALTRWLRKAQYARAIVFLAAVTPARARFLRRGGGDRRADEQVVQGPRPAGQVSRHRGRDEANARCSCVPPGNAPRR